LATPIRYEAGISRLCAPNPGLMTGDGTNCWIIDTDIGSVVIDPGPDIAVHVDAIVEHCDKVAAILVTHTHKDHSPAAKSLASKTGAAIYGMAIEDDGFQDTTIQFDVQLRGGESLQFGDRTLNVVHTPGHVGNHLCFVDTYTGCTFVGDHLMNGSTVVIIPPSGDMQAYIGSLKVLAKCEPSWLAPGHGERIDNALEVINHTVAHRLKRENKVYRALLSMGEASLDELVVSAYDDVDTGLHSWAKLSLEAHLIKLERECKANKTPRGYSPTNLREMQ